MIHRVAVITLAVTLSITALASAQEQPSPRVARSFQDLSAQVEPGANVSVMVTNGNEITGTITEISASSLGLMVGQNRLDLPESNVLRIEGPRDPLWDGVAIGAGVAFGSIVVSLAAAGCSESCFESPDVWAGIAFSTGVGAGIGLWVDWARVSRELIFLSPGPNPPTGAAVSLSPLLARDKKGLILSVSF